MSVCAQLQCVCVCGVYTHYTQWHCMRLCGCQMLLAECVDSGLRDCEGLSPAMWACRSDCIEQFNLLTDYHCQQNSATHHSGTDERDLSGRTCLHWSVRRVEPLECLRVCPLIWPFVLVTPLFKLLETAWSLIIDKIFNENVSQCLVAGQHAIGYDQSIEWNCGANLLFLPFSQM